MWWRLEAAARNNRKIRSVSDSAAWLWACCGMYSAEQLTDGFVPQEEVDAMLARASDKAALAQCFEERLLHEAKGGVKVHDYLDYNPSAAEVKKISRARSKAGRKGANVKHSSPGKCQDQVLEANDLSNGQLGGWVDGWVGGSETTAREQKAQGYIRGTWVRWMQEVHRLPFIKADESGLADAGRWALGFTEEEVSAAIEGLVRDDDPWVKKRGHTLRLLPERAATYLARRRDQDEMARLDGEVT